MIKCSILIVEIGEEYQVNLINKKKRKLKGSIACMILGVLLLSMPVSAADMEWRVMHGEQDALVLGVITEINGDRYLTEVQDVIMCQNDTVLNQQLPRTEVPEEMWISGLKYRHSYHQRKQPQVGDCIMASVDRMDIEGENWELRWLALEVSSTDAATLEVVPPERMNTDCYAWQLFINSEGETNEFAYSGNDLYADGEKVFSAVEDESVNEEIMKKKSENVQQETKEEVVKAAAESDVEKDDILIWYYLGGGAGIVAFLAIAGIAVKKRKRFKS